MIMKTIKNYCNVMLYTKQTIIKAIKMIVIKSKMKRKKERSIKINQIDKVVDRLCLCLFELFL